MVVKKSLFCEGMFFVLFFFTLYHDETVIKEQNVTTIAYKHYQLVV